MAQFLRPDGVISQGSWTNDHTAVNETTPVDTPVASQCYSQVNPNGSIFELSLTNPGGTPGAGTTTVRYRHAQVNSTPALSGTGTATALDVSIVQGTTVIASDAQQAPGGSWVTRTWTPDLSSVTDWNDLRIRFTATGGGGSPSARRAVAVSWAEVEAQNAAAAITGTLAATESGADTFAASGTVADPGITGTMAATDSGADTASASGTVAVAGTLAASETGADGFAGAGNVPIAGGLSATESGGDTLGGAGSVAVAGTLAGLETGADGFAASGTVGSTGLTGTLAATESGTDTAAAVGLVLIQGGLAAQESGGDGFSASGAVPIAGIFAAQEAANDNFSGAGVTIEGLTGTMAATESGQDYLDGWNLWRWRRPAPCSWGVEAEPAGEWVIIPPANGTWG